MIEVIPVGSGSTGNSIYLEMGGYHLLVDMGIGYKKIRDALAVHEKDIEMIDAVFLTHGHNDHVKSAEAISHHIRGKIYTGESVLYSIRKAEREKVILEEKKKEEILPGLYVTMFPVPHDYVRTCGFVFETEDRKIGYVSDCGKMNEDILEELYGCDTVILESNHDVEMLKKGPYPYQLKQRILSKYGHLSNEDCADCAVKLYEGGTRSFLLAHLSLHNNTPDLARKTFEEKMKGKDYFLYLCPEEGQDELKL